MQKKRIALFSFGGLLAVFVAVGAWIWFGDLGVFKPQIERWVSEQTGREFAIDGELHIDVGGTTRLTAEQVRFQNAEWDTPEQMLVLDRLELHVELSSVLGDGPIVVDHVALDGASVFLSQRDDGSANWLLVESVVDEEQDGDPTASDSSGGALDVRQITVADAELRFRAGSHDAPVTVSLEDAQVQLAGIGTQSLLSIDIDAQALRLQTDDASSTKEEAAEKTRLIPDINLPVEALNATELQLCAEIRQVTLNDFSASELVADVGLVGGVLEMPSVTFRDSSGSVALNGRLDSSQSPAKASIAIEAAGFDLGIGQPSGDDQDGDQSDEHAGTTLDFQANLEGVGDDLRALAKTSQGFVFANATGGRFENNALANVFLNDALQQILSAINPLRDSKPYTDMQCFVFAGEIEDGMLESVGSSIFSTDTVLASLRSEVNLDTEALDLKVRTTPQAGITLSASEILNPYIEIGGTLAQPSLNVDEAGVLLSGGAAVLTGGLSVLAKAALDRLTKSDDACVEAANESLEAIVGERPENEVQEAAP
ncbi:MAG: AsmA family protein [Pseudomonadota bacterium]